MAAVAFEAAELAAARLAIAGRPFAPWAWRTAARVFGPPVALGTAALGALVGAGYSRRQRRSRHRRPMAGRRHRSGVVYGRRVRQRYDAGFQPRARARRRTYPSQFNRRTGGYLGLEKKFLDMEYDAAVSATVAGSEADPTTFLSLNSIAQGDGESNRDGRHCKLRSIYISGNILFAGLDQATPTTLPYITMLLIRDRQTNGAQFNAEDVLKDPSNLDLETNAMVNLQHYKRFNIVKRFRIQMRAASSTWDGTSTLAGGQIVPFTMFKNVNDDIHFIGTTAVVANISDVSYHLICIGTPGIAANLRYIARTRFVG